MSIHRLQDGPLSLTPTRVNHVEGKFGPQVEFSDGQTSVYINEGPAEKGLARLGLDYESALGTALFFKQVKKDGKTYTNIELGAAGNAETPRSAAPSAPARPTGKSKEELFALYSECVAHALPAFCSVCDESGILITAEAFQAAAATLFIQTARL